jgi:hypothetical protein
MKTKSPAKKPTKRKRADPKQSARFIETAKEIGVDETPGAFEKAFRRVVSKKK